MSPTRNRPGLVASIVVALLAAAWSACTDSPPPARRLRRHPPLRLRRRPTRRRSAASPSLIPNSWSSRAISGHRRHPRLRPRRGHRGAGSPGQGPSLGGRDPDDIAHPRPRDLDGDRLGAAAEARLRWPSVADEVRERVEPHELQVWTYARQDRPGPAHPREGDDPAHARRQPRAQWRLREGCRRGRARVDRGGADQRTQRWQYRYKDQYTDDPTGARGWTFRTATPPPRASASRGLRPAGFTCSRYDRGCARALAQPPRMSTATATIGSDGIAMEEPWFCLERGRRFRIFDRTSPSSYRTGCSSARARRVTQPPLWSPFCCTTRPPGPWASFDPRTGEIVSRRSGTPLTNSYKSSGQADRRDRRSWMGFPRHRATTSVRCGMRSSSRSGGSLCHEGRVLATSQPDAQSTRPGRLDRDSAAGGRLVCLHRFAVGPAAPDGFTAAQPDDAHRHHPL